jgi:hypothetical protein
MIFRIEAILYAAVELVGHASIMRPIVGAKNKIIYFSEKYAGIDRGIYLSSGIINLIVL